MGRATGTVCICVSRASRPRLSYSRRKDRINSLLLHGLDKGGGGTTAEASCPRIPESSKHFCLVSQSHISHRAFHPSI